METNGITINLAKQCGIDMSLCCEVSEQELESASRSSGCVPKPKTCGICQEHAFEPPDWVYVCDVHSFCRPCADSHEAYHVSKQADGSVPQSESCRCPSCREPICKGSNGEWRRNIDSNEVTLAFMTAHPNYDPNENVDIKCPNENCVFEGPRQELKRHLAEECQYQEVDCPFKSVGCPCRSARHNIREHIDVYDHTSQCGFNMLLSFKKMTDDAAKESEERSKKRAAEDAVRIDNLATACGKQEQAVRLMGRLLHDVIAKTSRIETSNKTLETSNKELLKELKAAREDTKLVLDRFWRMAANGKDRVPIGHGSRPGGSRTQDWGKRKVQKLEKQLEEERAKNAGSGASGASGASSSDDPAPPVDSPPPDPPSPPPQQEGEGGGEDEDDDDDEDEE